MARTCGGSRDGERQTTHHHSCFDTRQRNRHSIRPMLRVISCIILCGLAGCTSRAPAPVAPVNLPNKPGADWFCEMHPNGEEWICVRDEELARHPKPSRLPVPEPEPTPAVEQPPQTPVEPVTPVNEPAASLSEPAESAPSSVQTPEPAPSPRQSSERAPKHVRLAYKPDKPVNIIELPPDLYAVQIVAMSSRDALEDFVSDNRLRGMSAARVANDGQVFYVLLLGIYETAAIANEAIEDIPPPMDKLSPWVRRLGSLQHAMIRADEITDNSSL